MWHQEPSERCRILQDAVHTNIGDLINVGTSTYHHVWFATKKRKWLLQADVEEHVRRFLNEIAQEKGIRLLEYETMVDHVHLLLQLGSEDNMSRIVNLLKGASARKVFQRFSELKLDTGVNHFWQKRYGTRVVEPRTLATVASYIRTQQERPEKFER